MVCKLAAKETILVCESIVTKKKQTESPNIVQKHKIIYMFLAMYLKQLKQTANIFLICP